MNLSSHVPTSSSSAKNPIASKGPGILIATGKPESRMRGHSKSDAASGSQVRFSDAYLGGLMDTAMWMVMWTFPNLKPGVVKKRQSWRDPLLIQRLQGNEFSKSDCPGGSKS